jgi:predicted DNA-binding protein
MPFWGKFLRLSQGLAPKIQSLIQKKVKPVSRLPFHKIIKPRSQKNVMKERDRYFFDKVGRNNCRLFGREDYFMIKAINLTESIEKRLLAICQQIGCKENELIEEAVLNYLEDFEDIQDANDRLSNRPEKYLTLAEVEQELGLANRV